MNYYLEALVVIIVGIALLPVVRSFVSTGQENATSSESILLGLVTLFWVLGVVGGAVAIAAQGFKKGK